MAICLCLYIVCTVQLQSFHTLKLVRKKKELWFLVLQKSYVVRWCDKPNIYLINMYSNETCILGVHVVILYLKIRLIIARRLYILSCNTESTLIFAHVTFLFLNKFGKNYGLIIGQLFCTSRASVSDVIYIKNIYILYNTTTSPWLRTTIEPKIWSAKRDCC